MDRAKPFMIVATEPGSTGTRPMVVDFECGEGCREVGRGTFWADGTQFIPDPTDQDQWPTGICELVSTQNEILSCWPENSPTPPRWPIPDCGMPIRPIQSLTVAAITDIRGSRCYVGEFKPFHRLGTVSEARCDSGTVFERNATSGAKTWPIYMDFVQNFDKRDMAISGPSWLSITDGFLIGSAPVVSAETTFEFVVTARNSKGAESVDLKITVVAFVPSPAQSE